MRTWACMVRVGSCWELYEIDENKGYICSVAQELRDGGKETGVMEIL